MPGGINRKINSKRKSVFLLIFILISYRILFINITKEW